MMHVDALSRAPIEDREETPAGEFEPAGHPEFCSTLVHYAVPLEDKLAMIQIQDPELRQKTDILRKPRVERSLRNNVS